MAAAKAAATTTATQPTDPVEPGESANKATSSPEPAAAADKDTPAKATPAKPATAKAPALVVLGPVVVLPLVAGGERYVYRGTPVGDEYTKEGVKHAQSVGLVGAATK